MIPQPILLPPHPTCILKYFDIEPFFLTFEIPYLKLTCRHTQSFYGHFSGTTRVSWCQKKSSGLYGAREDNRGRHTDHLDGCHSIRPSQ